MSLANMTLSNLRGAKMPSANLDWEHLASYGLPIANFDGADVDRAYVRTIKQETVLNSVCWRFDEAIGKRSSNTMAHWPFTACHCRTNRVHSRKVAVCAR